MYSKEQESEEKQKILDLLQKNLAEIAKMKTRMDKWAVILENTRIEDLLVNYTKPSRIIFLNLLAGLARGLGLTIGTALVLAALGYTLRQFISLPLIGEYIADLLDMINTHRYDGD